LESFIGELHLVDPPGSCVPGFQISVSRSSEGHGGDLALNVRLEALAELHYKSPGVSVSSIGDQGEEAVQVIVHRPVSLVVRRACQSINGICFCVDRKELTPELLFKVSPRLDRKNASVRLLARFSDHLAACPSLKKARVQKIFSSSQLNCSRARRRYNIQEFKKARPEVRSLEKSGGEGSFGLVHCLVGADGTGEGGLTGEGNVVTRGGATVGAGAGPVIS